MTVEAITAQNAERRFTSFIQATRADWEMYHDGAYPFQGLTLLVTGDHLKGWKWGVCDDESGTWVNGTGNGSEASLDAARTNAIIGAIRHLATMHNVEFTY